MITVGFHHGALCDSYEKQANDQGFTFGDDAEWVQQVGFGCHYRNPMSHRKARKYDTY